MLQNFLPKQFALYSFLRSSLYSYVIQNSHLNHFNVIVLCLSEGLKQLLNYYICHFLSVCDYMCYRKIPNPGKVSQYIGKKSRFFLWGGGYHFKNKLSLKNLKNSKVTHEWYPLKWNRPEICSILSENTPLLYPKYNFSS